MAAPEGQRDNASGETENVSAEACFTRAAAEYAQLSTELPSDQNLRAAVARLVTDELSRDPCTEERVDKSGGPALWAAMGALAAVEALWAIQLFSPSLIDP